LCFQILFPALALIFAIFLLGIVIFVASYAWRINKQYRRRILEDFEDDEGYFTHRGQTVRYQDPHQAELKYTAYNKIDPEAANLISKPSVNNNEKKLNDPYSNPKEGSELQVVI
jgi:hypothetical protein